MLLKSIHENKERFNKLIIDGTTSEKTVDSDAKRGSTPQTINP